MRKMTRLLSSSLAVILLALIGAQLGCGGGGIGSSTPPVVQAQNTPPTPTIIYGACPFPASSPVGFGSIWLVGSDASRCTTAWSTPGYGIPMPSGGTLKNLRVKTLAGADLIATVWVNGNPSALTCTIPASGPGVTGSCSDVAHQITVIAGDDVALGIVPQSVGGLSSAVRAAFEKQ